MVAVLGNFASQLAGWLLDKAYGDAAFRKLSHLFGGDGGRAMMTAGLRVLADNPVACALVPSVLTIGFLLY